MNVYITYDRYEHDEWYSVYHIETNKARAIKHFKEVDLIDFLAYGPDDCHSFQLQKVVLTKKEYLELIDLVENDARTEEELKDFLINIYDERDYEVETLMSTDGCSDVWDIVKYYAESYTFKQNCENYDNCDEDELLNIAQEQLFSNDELFAQIAKEYIKYNY